MKRVLMVALVVAAPTGAFAQAGLETAAADFTRAYLWLWSTDGPASVRQVTAAYSPRVRFYGRVLTRAGLEAEKRHFIQRWPVRRYSIRPGTLRLSCSGTRCLVRAVIDLRAENPMRAAVSRGSSRFAHGLELSSGKPVIFLETGYVQQRTGA